MKISNVSYNCNCSLVANRYYNPHISQFYATDPPAEKYHGMSPYTYTADNPVMLTDPMGMYFTGKNLRKALRYLRRTERKIKHIYKKFNVQKIINKKYPPKNYWNSN